MLCRNNDGIYAYKYKRENARRNSIDVLEKQVSKKTRGIIGTRARKAARAEVAYWMN